MERDDQEVNGFAKEASAGSSKAVRLHTQEPFLTIPTFALPTSLFTSTSTW